MGKHTRPRGRPPLALRPRLFAWVDLRTSITHFLTPDAAAAGRRSAGRYIALCGEDLIPASMTEPGRGYCEPCRTSIPTQTTAR